MKKGLTPKIRVLRFVKTNSVLFNLNSFLFYLLCVLNRLAGRKKTDKKNHLLVFKIRQSSDRMVCLGCRENIIRLLCHLFFTCCCPLKLIASRYSAPSGACLVCCLVAWLVGSTGLTPSCLGRGTGGDRDPRRWGRRETVPNVTLSPPGWLLMHSDGQR